MSQGAEDEEVGGHSLFDELLHNAGKGHSAQDAGGLSLFSPSLPSLPSLSHSFSFSPFPPPLVLLHSSKEDSFLMWWDACGELSQKREGRENQGEGGGVQPRHRKSQPERMPMASGGMEQNSFVHTSMDFHSFP